MTDTVTRLSPSALPPTEVELEAWRALPREEQIAQYREALLAPETQRASNATMTDILSIARQRVAARRA